MHDLGWEGGESSQTQEAKELGNGNEGKEKCKLNKIGFLCVSVCVCGVSVVRVNLLTQGFCARRGL